MQYCLKDRLSNICRASFEKPSESAECHQSQSGKQVSIETCFQDIQGCNNLILNDLMFKLLDLQQIL